MTVSLVLSEYLLQSARLPENADDDEKELIRSAVVQKGADRGTLRTQISGFGAGMIIYFTLLLELGLIIHAYEMEVS